MANQNKNREELSPLMRQYWSIKSQHPDELVFFRMGDFYELFYEDAILASRELGLTLTQRNKKAKDETPMCGLPHHSAAPYINKLLKRNHRVAICEQVEDPATAKGIVKRAVQQILTPGMVYDPDQLESSKAHFVVCLEAEVLAAVDVTSGESLYFRGSNDQLELLISVLPVAERIGEEKQTGVYPHSDVVSEEDPHLDTQFTSATACRRLLSYVDRILGSRPQHLRKFSERDFRSGPLLWPQTLQQLEIFESWGGEEGSLYHALNTTNTAAGARLLRNWMMFPLRDQKKIEQRLERVSAWISNIPLLKICRQLFAKMGDLERRIFRLESRQGHARDLLSLAESLHVAHGIYQNLGQRLPAFPPELLAWADVVVGSLQESLPLTVNEGFLFKRGYHRELDELIDLTEQTGNILQALEARERDSTGISSLKVRYTSVFGYYFEITNTHLSKVPPHYQRKQTLANAERFYTTELGELETRILSAQSKRQLLERHLFEELKAKVLRMFQELRLLADHLAEEDVLSSFAWMAVERRYVRPTFSDTSFELVQSRHPVLDWKLGRKFVGNSLKMSKGQTLVLTGPNMAGKSTLQRQVGLLCVMAQMGCYVPADSAQMVVMDTILTRIGAYDQLIQGKSTFMVEMLETAHILDHVREKSLVIIDEIGRGTSTFDGMSLAQAILEELLIKNMGFGIFATHYHELTVLQDKFPNLLNAHMKVQITDTDIRFLHTLSPGPAERSYGIYVARKAGIAEHILQRAQGLLVRHEAMAVKKPRSDVTAVAGAAGPKTPLPVQGSFL